MTRFDEFPDEIIEIILLQLRPKDILSCSSVSHCHHNRLATYLCVGHWGSWNATQVCRRLNSVAHSSAKIQLVLQLGVEGFRMQNNWHEEPQLYSSNQILANFKAREDRKRQLTYSYQVATSRSSSFIHFIDGLIGYVSQGPDLEKYLLFWAPNHETTNLADSDVQRESIRSETQVLPAPTGQDTGLRSSDRESTCLKYRIDELPSHFTWDVSQDLVLFVTTTVAQWVWYDNSIP